MGINSHINWDTYRREVSEIADEHPEVAVAVVKHDFPSLVDHARTLNLEDLLLQIEFDVVNADIRTGSSYTSHEFEYWDNEDVEVFKNIQNNLSEVTKVVTDLQEEGIDTEWVSKYDCDRILGVKENGLESHLDEQESRNNNTITFPTKSAAVIWMNEITGQISDGAWENKNWSWGDWSDYTDAQVEVDESLETAEWDGVRVDSLGITQKMTEYSGMVGRMIFYVRASGVDPSYTKSDLEEDLRSINTMDIE